MSWSWQWLIVHLLFICLTQARYIRLPPVNCSESSPIGSPIVQLLHLLPSSNWAFTFLTQTSSTSYFLLDDLKGTITVKHRLDREDICRLGLCSCINQCLLKLEINAVSDTKTHILHVPIVIIDENDNFCYFAQNIYRLNISEGVRLNTRLALPVAHDPDQAPNNVQSYSIVPNHHSEFQFDSKLSPAIIVSEPLDRENCSEYHFDLCAHEGLPSQTRSCCTKLYLIITDINDNSAQFEHDQQSPLIVRLSELSPIGTPLIQMKAHDPDEGLNGQIRYTFSKWTQSDPSLGKLFHLDADTGWITLAKHLDYEERINYELQIQAKDLGPNAIPTYATVIVQVIDENDCSPEIFPFSPSDVQLINNSIIFILENVSVGTPIVYMTITDRDSGENGQVTVELSSQSDNVIQLQKAMDNTYAVVTSTPLDREQQSFYSFFVTAFDHGEPRRSTRHTFELHLIDVNDCSPHFEQLTSADGVYHFDIDENNERNTILGTIRASDPDEQDRVTVRLELDGPRLFSINEQHELIVAESLDREKQARYEFYVVAEDQVGHVTRARVVVNVRDMNDNEVKFLSNYTRLEISENQPIDTLIGNIQAEDRDSNDQIIYIIHPNDLHRVEHLVRLDTDGHLRTVSILDREHLESIQFRVIANDSLHIATTQIELFIIDQNDHAPKLVTQSPLCVLHNISNSNSTISIHLEAYDPDQDDNGRISFSLLSPSTPSLTLLPNGTILVNLVNIPIAYSFDLRLQDHGKPQILSSSFSQFVLIIVKDLSQCTHRRSLVRMAAFQFDQRTFVYLIAIICIGLACFAVVIILICCCCYIRRQQQKQKHKKYHMSNTAAALTPSFSSSLNEDAENDTLLLSSPSPQFTATTTASLTTNESTRLSTFVNTDRPTPTSSTNKSSSLSSCSSSTYVKMSRSFEDEML